MSFWDRMKLLKIYIQLVNDPSKTELIFQVIRITSSYKNDPLTIRLVDHVMGLPGFRELYDDRYLPAWPTLEQLRTYPTGSFGEALLLHLTKNGLDLELFPRIVPHDPLEYLNARAYQDHDLWHALSGYGSSVEDELALQAFTVAQIGSPLGSFIISGGLLHLILRDPLSTPRALEKIGEGFRMGKRCRFLLGQRLMDMLPLPIDEVRRDLGLRDVLLGSAIGPSQHLLARTI